MVSGNSPDFDMVEYVYDLGCGVLGMCADMQQDIPSPSTQPLGNWGLIDVRHNCGTRAKSAQSSSASKRSGRKKLRTCFAMLRARDDEYRRACATSCTAAEQKAQPEFPE